MEETGVVVFPTQRSKFSNVEAAGSASDAAVEPIKGQKIKLV